MTERQIALWLDAEGEAEIARRQCLKDKLQPADIARMVLFLAADDARMCTAAELHRRRGMDLIPQHNKGDTNMRQPTRTAASRQRRA